MSVHQVVWHRSNENALHFNSLTCLDCNTKSAHGFSICNVSYPVAVEPAPKEIVKVQQNNVVNDVVNFEETNGSTVDGMFGVMSSNNLLEIF